MSTAAKPLVLADEFDEDAAPTPVVLMAEDGTQMKQAANVSSEGTVADLVSALVAAGLMADAS